jgi:NAD(P)-binding Rossmann-like domain/Flavin containing amine oxidoreductase
MNEPEAGAAGEAPAVDAGGPTVTVVGGGIAGLSAALRLAEQGYSVTLYEQKAVLGGNLASRAEKKGAASLDVYPHMFQGWYRNFWKLMADVGVKQKKSFTPFNSVYQLRRPKKGHDPSFEKLTDPYSAETVVENLFSGVASPADMFVFGYASLDLQAELVNAKRRLLNTSLTGYLQSRPYMTTAALNAYEAFVLRVWGLPAYMISALDCRDYAAYCYGAADEPGWLTTASAQDTVIEPIVDKLNERGAVIAKDTALEGVTLIDVAKEEHFAVDTIQLQRMDTGDKWAEKVENLVLAVPPSVLAELVLKGERGKRIVDALPGLVELRRIRSQEIPVLHVALKKRLTGLPRDPVALYGSKLNLAFTDISQVWKAPKFKAQTMLAVSCSEPLRQSGPYKNDDAFEMIVELAEFLPFEPGGKWEDAAADVDWGETAYEANADAKLTLNAIGTDAWRPHCVPGWVTNLFFAGDFCRHDFGITTVEAAVATGLAAANGVMAKEKVGTAVDVLKPATVPRELFLTLRYTLLPAAMAAMAWARMSEDEEPYNPDEPKPLERMITSPQQELSTLRYLFTPGLPPREEA